MDEVAAAARRRFARNPVVHAGGGSTTWWSTEVTPERERPVRTNGIATLELDPADRSPVTA
jgi:hypothetical protein